MSRFWCLLVASVVNCVGQICGARVENPHMLIFVSALTGCKSIAPLHLFCLICYRHVADGSKYSGLRFSLWRIPLAYSTSLWHQWSLYKLGIHDPFTGFIGQHLQHSLWYPSFPSPSFLYLFYLFFQQIFFHL